MTTSSIPGVRGRQRLVLVNVFTKAVADRLLATVIVGVGLGAMGLAMGPMFLALRDVLGEMLAQIPDGVMSIAGGADMTTPSGWYTGEMYSIMVPFGVMFVAVSSAARAFGGEMEGRTLGLVLATPTRRSRLAFDKIAAMLVHVVLASMLIGLGVWLGIVISGIEIPLGGVVAISVMLALISIAVGGLAMLVSIVTGRGALAMLVGMLVAVAAYAWSSFVPLADAVVDLAWLSPWHHYIATDPMGSGIDWASAAWLLVLGIVPLALSVYLFRRRDIAA